MLVPGLAALAWIAGRQVRLRRGARANPLPVPAVISPWAWPWPRPGAQFWGLYAAYDLDGRCPVSAPCRRPGSTSPRSGAIALLGAWLLVRVPAARPRWPRWRRPPSCW